MGVGIAVVAIMVVIFGKDVMRGNIATQDYEIYVDPLIDKQNLFITGRVTIQNTGGLPLTNVKVKNNCSFRIKFGLNQMNVGSNDSVINKGTSNPAITKIAASNIA